MRRNLVLATLAGLFVGTGVGGAVGYREGRLAGWLAGVGEQQEVMQVITTLREQAASEVKVGMTKSEAEIVVTREGYKPEEGKRDQKLSRWSKPWRHGLQYVTIRFDQDRVDDVSNLWIDS